MTLIEFYDKSHIENMISTLMYKPERVIFVGDKKAMKKQLLHYEEYLRGQGLETEVEFRSAEKHNLPKLVEVLSDIVEKYDDCLFELTGGEELLLVAVGIVFERYKDKKLQMQRCNIRNGRIYDCDNDGVVADCGQPQLTIDQSIQLHGGRVIYDDEKPDTTHIWEFSRDFQDDVNVLWDICRGKIPVTVNREASNVSYPQQWNLATACLADLERYNSAENRSNNVIHVPVFNAAGLLKGQYFVLQKYLDMFQRCRLLDYYEDASGTWLTVEFKNEQIYKCLTKSGTVLELKTYMLLSGCSELNDIAVGVFMDWDSDVHEKFSDIKDTENEIDVVIMKNLVPAFISCKCGAIETEELYKLNTVTNRLGGKYAKKLLIATDYGAAGNSSVAHFIQRAKDMQIGIVDYVHEMTDDEFRKAILSELSSKGF